MTAYEHLHPTGWRRWRQAFWRLLALLCLAPAALAQTAENRLPELTRAWLDQALANSSALSNTPLRMEVSIGSLDSRLRLAPCAQIEPHLPSGSRLWGKTRIGLRCVDGSARWNVTLPVTVQAFGPAWVVRSEVAAGATLGENDLMQAEVDWAQDPSPVLATQAQWLGLVATRPLAAGQALRQNMVRAAQVFQAGTQVRVLAQGPGFQITADGQALGPGLVGQPVRIRMDNGRVMSATVLDGRTVKLEI